LPDDSCFDENHVKIVHIFNYLGTFGFIIQDHGYPDPSEMFTDPEHLFSIPGTKYLKLKVNSKSSACFTCRKGSTRAFPPHHPLIPVDYQLTGQPVLIGGTMGTCSYVLTGTEQGMQVHTTQRDVEEM
jgi:hypothetical protein